MAQGSWTVMAESEDKSRSWQERKAATLRHLESACRDVKILALGDKLSNIRSTASDYLVHGDRVFLRFNEKKKEKHAGITGELQRHWRS